MTAVQPIKIDALPEGPSTNDPDHFDDEADALVAALPVMIAQQNVANTMTYENAVIASASAENAVASAAIAAASAAAAQAVIGVTPYVAGTNYAQHAAVVSLLNSQTYRRTGNNPGATAVDPANDQANWRLLSGNDSNGAFVAITVPALNIDLSLGNYFVMSIAANSAVTFSNVPAGGYSFSIDMEITAPALVAFPDSVRTPSNTSTPLSANKSHQLMFVTKNGGARWKLVTAANFDI